MEAPLGAGKTQLWFEPLPIAMTSALKVVPCWSPDSSQRTETPLQFYIYLHHPGSDLYIPVDCDLWLNFPFLWSSLYITFNKFNYRKINGSFPWPQHFPTRFYIMQTGQSYVEPEPLSCRHLWQITIQKVIFAISE